MINKIKNYVYGRSLWYISLGFSRQITSISLIIIIGICYKLNIIITTFAEIDTENLFNTNDIIEQNNTLNEITNNNSDNLEDQSKEISLEEKKRALKKKKILYTCLSITALILLLAFIWHLEHSNTSIEPPKDVINETPKRVLPSFVEIRAMEKMKKMEQFLIEEVKKNKQNDTK